LKEVAHKLRRGCVVDVGDVDGGVLINDSLLGGHLLA
jgi:hypothetical protein